MYRGFIKLWRKITEWEWYQDSKTFHLFCHLLISANHEDEKWKGQEIRRGQLITGLKSLKQQTGISAQSLRTCLERLKSTGEITSKSTNRFRIITLLNYEIYQGNSDSSTSKLTSKLTNNQQTTNKQLTSNKNDKNDKNDKNTLCGKQVAADIAMNLQEFITSCENNPRRDIQLIASYAEAIGDNNLKLKSQWQGFIRQNLRAAKKLMPFSDEQILNAVNRIKELNTEKPTFLNRWTMETILKYIINPN